MKEKLQDAELGTGCVSSHIHAKLQHPPKVGDPLVGERAILIATSIDFVTQKYSGL